MSDEFVKGLAILTTAGLGWMVLAGWYRTPGFEEAQLTGAVPESLTVYDQIGVVLMAGLFWFAVIGTLTFWVIIPAVNEARAALEDEQ